MKSILYQTFRETLAYDLLLAIITGVLSAGAFFLALRIFKPRIKIGDKIVKTIKKNKDGSEKTSYYFKFYNSTKANIENVSIDLFLMEDYFHGSAKNYKTRQLKIAQSEFKFLTGKRHKNNEIHNNCVQMRIVENLESEWNGKREWLHLQIDATHSKSGRRKVYVKTYKDPSVAIAIGKFDAGENFKIIR